MRPAAAEAVAAGRSGGSTHGVVRHLLTMDTGSRARLFATEPRPTSVRDGRRAFLAAVGPILYVPASRPGLASIVRRRRASGVNGVVVDLEDSVRDDQLDAAWRNAGALLEDLDADPVPDLVVWIRVRQASGIGQFRERFGDPAALAGFVLPKCDPDGVDEAVALGPGPGRGPWLMPVVETTPFVNAVTRADALRRLSRVLLRQRDHVLAVRFGAVDLAGSYGLRLDGGRCVHDIPMIATALGDLVGVVSGEPVDLPVTGPVHENYRLDHDGGLGDFVRAVELDRAAGLWGKSVIHPRQAEVVHALGPVEHHDWEDARSVVGSPLGGVAASADRRRMNESKPHARWAERVLTRARACGVLIPGATHTDVLESLRGPHAWA